MKQSLSRRFFFVCMSCVLASTLVLGIVFFAFSTKFFEEDKYDMMQRNATIAANFTANNYVSNNLAGLNDNAIFTTFTILSGTIDADFVLADLTGIVLYHTGPNALIVEGSDIFAKPAKDVINKGIYRTTGNLGSTKEHISYIVGVPVLVEGQAVGTIFVTAPAKDMFTFLREVIKVFVIATSIVLLLSFIIIYQVTSLMVSPLKQMVDATHSFAEGDFSRRIPVYRQDEVGQLSMAFNNMASTLALNENSRRSFVANVSHELKTPMTTIGGFVDGILDGTIPTEKQDQYLKIVSSEVKRLSRLVHSMLDTARIDAGEMELNREVFDISELVRQSIFSFEQSVEEKRLNILGLEKDRKMVFADRDLIHQVVYNLIENAVKFVNPEGDISVRYQLNNGMLNTTIRNTGDGLSKEESAQIFERFYKSDRSRSGHQGGVGLGLHIVKSIVNYHNGELSAHSVEHQYTEFTFSVTAAPEKNIKSSKQANS